ncbi:MAG: hypothetical protein IPF59_09760 [Ignavibacteria bacterium]|nr:hypothetical protein [Ignavibacteria bacterium]MBK6420578.1 hypothetical protein [Ignavibacteria bacterium]MBK7033488.1 hypothetical protein [Ignavibacteria bacterium]
MDRRSGTTMTLAARFSALVVVVLYGSVIITAQSETSDFARIGHAGFILTTATDYQCVGINPANLGFVPEAQIFSLATPMMGGSERRRRDWAFTAIEGGFSAHSNALARGDIFDLMFQSSSGTFTSAQKQAAVEAFSDGGMRFNADVIAIGASYQSQDFGGFALTVRERATGTFILNDEAANLIFKGRDSPYFDSLAVNWNGDSVAFATAPKYYSELFDGTVLSMLWFREFAGSYGLKILDVAGVKVYAGATVKYFESYAYLDARVQQASFVARSALSPFFGINYGKATTPSVIPGSALAPIGTGWGLDVGATVEFDRWTLSASIVDMGKMVFDGNVYNAGDTILNGLSSTGFDGYNIFNEAQKITGDGEFFKWEGLQSADAELPTRIKFGASFFYSYRLQFGIDAVASLNTTAGSMSQPVVSGGANYRATPWLKLGIGIGGGSNMGVFVPVSILFSVFDGFWEMGLTSRDLVTYLVNKTPVVSLATGFLRFRI